MRIAGIFVLAVIGAACRTPVVRQAPETVAVTRLFGPVVGPEIIGGRADTSDAALLLAGGLDVVRVDLMARQAVRTHLALGPGESCWGLARLSNGALWTIKGRHTLARVNHDGSLAAQVTLPAPQFDIFAVADRLVYQEATFVAPRPALLVASADGTSRVPWSGITTRAFDRLARASAAALNLLACGATRTRERACWFPDEAAVFLLNDEGTTRRVPLAGLRTVSPEVLLTSDNPARPVRDAYVAGPDEMWVLSSGIAPPEQADVPGGWVLARYSTDGRPRGQSRLPEAARMILRVDGPRVTLLLSSGHVGEVRAW
jgi:hypothetical protein